MSANTSPKTAAVLSTLLSSFMLGTSYVAVKLAVGETNPFLLGAATAAVGSALVIAIMLWRGTFTKDMFRHWEFWAGSLINTWVVGLSYVGLTMTAASAAGLIIGSNVIFVAFFSWIAFRERMSHRRLLGVAIALLGLVTLTTRWNLSVFHGSQMVGNLLMLLAAAGIGVTVVFSRFALRKLRSDQWALGMHLLLPLTLFLLSVLVPLEGGLDRSAIPAVLFIGAVCTTIPTILWTGALRHISVVTSATVLMVESAFAVFLSWLVLGENMDGYVIAGALMIFTAILLLARSE
ncbi:MAG: DMT family transporter [Methanomassiliicoccales archaeon]|nr:DMT family transporter [Methanomassiliicoccales archaeon]